MSKPLVSITDDRGRRVALFDWPRSGPEALRLRSVNHKINAAIGLHRAGWWFGAAVGIVVVATSGVIKGVWGTGAPRWVWFAVLVSIAVVCRLILRRVLVTKYRGDGDRIASIVLGEGLCPGCASVVAGRQPGADGRVECAKCGAAWRAVRIGDPPVSAAPPRRRSWLDGLKQELRACDHRERHVLVLRPHHLRLLVVADPAHAERVRWARQRARRTGLVPRIVVGGSFIALGINGLYFFLSIAPMAGGSPPVGCVPAAPLVMLGLAALVLTSDFGVQARVLIAKLLAERICPSCGCDLTGVEREEDGCVVCPGCGGAWRVPESVACARCGYSLEGLAGDAQGRVTCPECGATM